MIKDHRFKKDLLLKIAVVGSVISGLGSAWLLPREHRVHLFESDSRLGGHANTEIVAENEKKIPMDTGFLVYNEAMYPNLCAFFKALQVETVDSNMSLSVQVPEKNLEWRGTSLNTIFAQRRNLVNMPVGVRTRMFLQLLKNARHGTIDLPLPDGKQTRYGSGDRVIRVEVRAWAAIDLLFEKGDLGLAEAVIENTLIVDDVVALVEWACPNDQDLAQTLHGAVERTGCKITAVINSPQQARHNIHRIEKQKMNSHVQLIEQDYRDFQGKFDKVVSIEMIEAETLKVWRENFNRAKPHVEAMDFYQKFDRLWNLYLPYCEGAFRAGRINVGQFLITK